MFTKVIYFHLHTVQYAIKLGIIFNFIVKCKLGMIARG